MNTIQTALVAGACLLSTAGGAFAEEHMPAENLAGTIWLATGPHDRTTIDLYGKITVKEGKHLYVAFGDRIDGVYTIRIHWWNEEEGISVVEYAVLYPEEENLYAYLEVAHPADSGFPGIHGSGYFTLIDDHTASFTQQGRLLDGSASAFVTEVELVDELPEVPVAQTYPPQM